jgi:hemerythrin superfamily protein
MTDIIELVLRDHHAVAELFDKLQSANPADDQTDLLAQVRDALERHASAEEKVLYPRVRKEVPDGREDSKDAIEEHDQIRGSLEELEEHEAGTELFTLAVLQLVATTKHHVGVEESELLPDFRKNSDASEREELGRRFAEAKTKAPAS